MNMTWSWMKQVIACVSGTEIKILIKRHQEAPLQQFFFLFSFISILLCSEFPLIGSDIKLQSVWQGYTQVLPSFHITLHQTALINYHIEQKQETGGRSAMESRQAHVGCESDITERRPHFNSALFQQIVKHWTLAVFIVGWQNKTAAWRPDTVWRASLQRLYSFTYKKVILLVIINEMSAFYNYEKCTL